MSTTTDELPKGATAAVNEAARITRDAARRSTETAKASIDVARSYLDEANLLGQDLFVTWTSESEAMLKAGFDAQNASVDAAFALFDLAVKSNRQVMEQYSRVIRQTQAQTLETWQAAASAFSKTFEAPVR